MAEKAILVGDMPGAGESCIKNLSVDMPFPAMITPVTRRFEEFGKKRCPGWPLAFAPATSIWLVFASVVDATATTESGACS